MSPSSAAPHWERFRSVLIARRPEGAASVRGEIDGRFVVEIPSAHPTIHAPLTIEIADREPGGSIDVFWGRYFEHVLRNRTLPFEASVGDQFDRALAMVEEWMGEEWMGEEGTGGEGAGESRVFALTFDRATGRRTGWGRLPFPLPEAILARTAERGERIEFWSWRGTRDGEWPVPSSGPD